ncbi:MAG: hypothetical protein JO119_16720 [Acidobacteria bacterium]|nr:hypothetical protein [Acidobacteriota bacterium]
MFSAVPEPFVTGLPSEVQVIGAVKGLLNWSKAVAVKEKDAPGATVTEAGAMAIWSKCGVGGVGGVGGGVGGVVGGGVGVGGVVAGGVFEPVGVLVVLKVPPPHPAANATARHRAKIESRGRFSI